MKKVLLFVFVLVTAAFSARPFHVESSERFSSRELFGKLDSVGKGGAWMEWDSGGILDPEIGQILLNEKGTVRAEVENAWLQKGVGGNSVLAVLETKDSGEQLLFYALPELSANPVPLSLREPLDPRKIFRDFRETLPGRFVHLDDTNLQVIVRENEIEFSYMNPDRQPLLPVENFSKLPESRKKLEVQMRKDFYAYEYSLMVQAFVASVRGIFNWQAWHWLDERWTKGSRIGDREIEAILSSPAQGKLVRVFYRKTSSGDVVEMLSNSNGSFLMTVVRRK